jgi:hypothetical protein
MSRNHSGLLIEIADQPGLGYHRQFYFDLMEIALKRLSFNLAQELSPHGISALAIAPGFMRTEANWKDALTTEDAQRYGWGGSETPCFTGRAVAAHAADPHIARKSAGIFTSWQLAEEYGFTDIDGGKPNRAVLEDAIQAYFAHKPAPPPHTWELSVLPQSLGET